MAQQTLETADMPIKVLKNQIQSISTILKTGRRKNERIICLPEDTEGSNPTKFFESWMLNLLWFQMKSGQAKIQRAHCTLAPKLGPNQRP